MPPSFSPGISYILVDILLDVCPYRLLVVITPDPLLYLTAALIAYSRGVIVALYHLYSYSLGYKYLLPKAKQPILAYLLAPTFRLLSSYGYLGIVLLGLSYPILLGYLYHQTYCPDIPFIGIKRSRSVVSRPTLPFITLLSSGVPES
jgi:hypothetical protein